MYRCELSNLLQAEQAAALTRQDHQLQAAGRAVAEAQSAEPYAAPAEHRQALLAHTNAALPTTQNGQVGYPAVNYGG